MTEIGKKLQVGTAACVIAAATALTPAVAHADPAAPLPMSTLGTVAGQVDSGCEPMDSPDCAVAPRIAGSSLAASGFGSLFQNDFIWIGRPPTSPPPLTTVFTFAPLTLVPGFLRPLFSWFEDVNAQICVAGLTLRVGPYGTVSGGYSRGCA